MWPETIRPENYKFRAMRSGATPAVGLSSARPAQVRLRGGTDRRITLLAMVMAAGFVGLTIASLVTPALAQHGSWLPLHVLLAGAATTAIAGVMPFFSAAVSGAPPANGAVRLAGVLTVAAGAVVLVIGRGFWPAGTGVSGSVVAGIGGLVYIGGLLAVTAATLGPLRAAVGPRRFFMGAIYGVALLNIIVGVSLSTLFLLGWGPVIAAWGGLKPAHAWLNLFGFVSLVIGGSLLHLLPTVVGARIRRTRASLVTFAALATGPAFVALGFVTGSDQLAIGGAFVTFVGAAALGWHAVAVLRSRAAWTTDPAWHRFTSWSLVAGIGWFLVASLIALGQVVAGGSSAGGWSLAPLAAPLGVGWAAQVLIGAWSHLVPAVGPGTPPQHARQRYLLGLAATPRLLLANGGVAAVVVGSASGMTSLEMGGMLAIVSAGIAALALIAASMAILLRPADAALGPRPAGG
jgi:nitrite reductase (NO-forming)